MLRAAIGVLASVGCLCVLFVARPLRADDPRTEQIGEMRPVYPRTKAELEKWVSAWTTLGKTRPQDVVAVFGNHYRHPQGVGDVCPDVHRFEYELNKLGVSGHGPTDVIEFTFEEQTGRLTYVYVGDAIRQTGFYAEVPTGP